MFSMILGWEWIDNALQKTLTLINDIPSDLYGTVAMGRALAAVIALLVLAAETYLMMLGRKGMDVMKILRVAIIAIAITNSGAIAGGIRHIFIGDGSGTDGIEGSFKKNLEAQEKQITELQIQIFDKRTKMNEAIDEKRYELEKAKWTAIFGDNKVSGAVASGSTFAENTINDLLANTIGLNQRVQSTLLGGALKRVATWVGETIFQVFYYGVLVGQRIFLAIMTIFLPFVLALSLAPMYKNAWSQWLSKYVSLCLWGIVLYITMYYINILIIECLNSDLKDIDTTINNAAESGKPWANLKAMWDDNFNSMSNCLSIVVAYLIGAYIIRQVPEICGWVVPGGVSSHWGHTVGGVGQAATMFVAAKTVQAAGAVMTGGTSAAAGAAASAAGGGASGVNTGIGGDQSRGFGSRNAEPPAYVPPASDPSGNNS